MSEYGVGFRDLRVFRPNGNKATQGWGFVAFLPRRVDGFDSSLLDRDGLGDTDARFGPAAAGVALSAGLTPDAVMQERP
jgi:hypothetical protein